MNLSTKYVKAFVGFDNFMEMVEKIKRKMSEVKFSKEHEWITLEGRSCNYRYRKACN